MYGSLDSVWLPALVDAAIKGSLVMAIPLVGSLFMRRLSAATRHLVWFLAIVSLLGIPVLSLALPGWHVLPAWTNVAVTIAPPTPRTALAPAVPQAAVPAAPRDLPLPAEGNPPGAEVRGARHPLGPAEEGATAAAPAAAVATDCHGRGYSRPRAGSLAPGSSPRTGSRPPPHAHRGESG